MRQTRLGYRISLVALLVILSCGAAWSGVDAAQEAAETLKDLRQVELPSVWLGDVPPPARALIKKLKHKLRDLLVASIGKQPAESIAPEIARSNILDMLKVVGLKVGEGEWGGWGVYEITIERPDAHRNLVTATVTLQIPCGTDTSLYAFERLGDPWKLTLALEANDYELINGAQGDFEYVVSPPDDEDQWFIATAHFGPWCTSTTHPIHYSVVRPGPTAGEPLVLLKKQDNNARTTGNRHVTAERNAFQLTFNGRYLLETIDRTHVVRYSVVDNEAKRIQPLALTPGDFVDEWLRLPWDEASEWVDADNVPVVKLWHTILHDTRDYHLRIAQPCDESGSTWHVGIRKWPPEDPEEWRYFTITMKDHAYYVERIGEVRQPGCPGEASPEGWR